MIEFIWSHVRFHIARRHAAAHPSRQSPVEMPTAAACGHTAPRAHHLYATHT